MNHLLAGLLLAAAASCAHASLPAFPSPGVVDVDSGEALLAALRNSTVIGIAVDHDIDMLPSLPSWQALGADVLLSRNVTIFGKSSQQLAYPAMLFRFWANTTVGVRLAPGITITFTRLLLKQLKGFAPDMVVGGDSTSSIVIYDCLRHLYVTTSASLLASVIANTARPAWAPALNNSAVILPSGDCRLQPGRPMCWGTAVYVINLADNTTFLAQSGPTSIRLLVYGMAMVIEQPVSFGCFDAYYSGKNVSCVGVESKAIQVAEAATLDGWLPQVPTLDRIAAAIAGLAALPALPNAKLLLPSWAWPAEGPQAPAVDPSSPPPSQPDEDGGVNKGLVIGLSVGLGGAALILAVAGVLLWRKHRSRQALPNLQPPEDKQASTSLSDNQPPHSPCGIICTAVTKSSTDASPESTLSNLSNTPAGHEHSAAHSGRSAGHSDSQAVCIELYEARHGPQDMETGGTHSDLGARTRTTSSLEAGAQGASGPGSHDRNMRSRMELASVGSTATASSALGTASSATAAMSAISDYPNLLSSEQDQGVNVFRLAEVITQTSPVAMNLNLQVDMASDVVLGPKIGSGGMGTVYRATYRGSQVAVKVFAEGSDMSSFSHEISILGRTAHPNVVQCLGACFNKSNIALLEELCDGSLEQLMYSSRRDGQQADQQQAAAPDQAGTGFTQGSDPNSGVACTLPVLATPLLPLSTVLSIAIQTAAGLAYLHPTIIHRDLKPGNILLVTKREPGSGGSVDSSDVLSLQPPAGAAPAEVGLPFLQVKLSDFGLSRMRDAMTIVTQRPYAGTVPYMAPECFNRQHQGLTHKADIYSFGMCLWELLHGVRPWTGYAPAEVLYQVAVKNTRPAIVVSEERCPRQLRKLLGRCWDFDPDRRPSALEIVRELAFMQRKTGQTTPAQARDSPPGTN